MALPFASALAGIPRKAVRWTIAGLPEGADALVLVELARATGGADILHVARDGQRLERLQDGLRGSGAVVLEALQRDVAEGRVAHGGFLGELFCGGLQCRRPAVERETQTRRHS